MDELVRELEELQGYAAGLRKVFDDATAMTPRHAEGTDPTGAVTVELGPDGVPAVFRVDRDFENLVSPAEFGAAVERAFEAAMAARLEAWGQALDRDGWQSKVDNVGSSTPQPATTRPNTPPRDVNALVEDMIKAIDHSMQAPPPAPRSAVGRSGELTLTLPLLGGLSCTASPGWVNRQTASKMMTALGEALGAARSQLREMAAAPQPKSQLEELIGEAFGMIGRS